MAFKGFGRNLTVRQAHELSHNIGLDTLEEDTGTYTYIGTAPSGTATSVTDWSIQRITNADNTIKSAMPSTGKEDTIFSNEWDERANLDYND